MAENQFSLKTTKYADPCFPWGEDHSGFYFPDSVVDPFVEEAEKKTVGVFEIHLNETEKGLSPLNRHRLLIREPQLSWEESCDLVIAAFERFHPGLGAKAKEVIQNRDRWILDKTEIGEAAGCCHPANCKTNPKPYAVIKYSYDGTINDAVYIAHELGHLIADDYINEAGFTYQDGKRHMAEVQAFFTQHVLYDYLASHPDVELRQAARNHFVGEITRSLYSLPMGIGALEAENAALSEQSDDIIRASYSTTMRTWLGERWPEYEKAKRLSDHVTDAKKRDDWGICELHQHPMASIIATGLFLQASQTGRQQRERIASSLFGGEGPKNIADVVLDSGIDNKQSLKLLARDSINYIAVPLICLQNPKPTVAVSKATGGGEMHYEM